MAAIIVPAREGRGVKLLKGARIRVTTPKGRQAADFFAFNAANIREWLSPPHSWVTTFSVKPRLGDVLISRSVARTGDWHLFVTLANMKVTQ